MESEFLEWLKNRFEPPSQVPIGIGDDAAVISSGDWTVVATDAIVDGVHFCSAEHDYQLIGRKALGVNLSDIAAMGASPHVCVLSLICGENQNLDACKQMVEGLVELGHQFDCPLVGGDFVKSSGPLTLSVTVLGELGDVEQSWRLSGAQAGDSIFVTGPLGGSIARKHLEFTPRLDVVDQLKKRNIKVNAATDITDGLARDLALICRASRAGAELFQDDIPMSLDAIDLSKSSNRSALEHALYDGEDFELLFAISKTQAEVLKNHEEFSELYLIGQIIDQSGLWMLDGKSRKVIEEKGYEH